MTPADAQEIVKAKAIVKAINRKIRRGRFIDFGPYGTDYATWSALFPQIAAEYSKAAATLAGKPGRYLPRFR